MKQFLLALSLIAATACQPLADAQKSVKQLIRTNGTGYCSAFSIDETKGYWFTAAHCLDDANSATIIRRIKSSFHYDMAIISIGSETAGPSLELAEQEPKIGDEVIAVCYPGEGGNRVPMFLFGRVSQLNIVVLMTQPVEHLNEWHTASGISAPGCSGGPVLDKNRKVVGMIHALANFTGAPMAMFATVKNLREFSEDYWE